MRRNNINIELINYRIYHEKSRGDHHEKSRDGIPITKKVVTVKLYYVNRVAQPNGEHEVHTSTCRFLPAASNRVVLGYFFNSRDALQAARRIYSNVDGCFYCCSDSHHR